MEVPFAFLVLTLCLIQEPLSIEGYYWKDYFGTVPKDAFVAGKNKDGKHFYVGQVVRIMYDGQRASGTGTIPVQIYSGVKDVTTYYQNSVKTYSNLIKILCGRQENFKWIPTNSTHFYADTAGKERILGGFVFVNNYVGKMTESDGKVKIGSAEQENDGNVYLYPIRSQSYGRVTNFETLVYDEDYAKPSEGCYVNLGKDDDSTSANQKYQINIHLH